MLNRIQDDPRLSSVTTDNVGGGRLAAAALMASGHEKIALIAGWEGASTSRDREFGFVAELNAGGRSLFARAVGHFDLERTAQATHDLFGQPEGKRPDAVFVANDYMAIRTMDVLRFELGLRVPQDVSVVGFDDTVMASLPTYNLTTVRQPVSAMVDAALRLLFERIEKPDADAAHLILRPILIERGSVRSGSS